MRAIRPWREPCPFLERAVKCRWLGKTKLFGDVLNRQFVAAQVVDGQVATQVVFEFLKTGAFFAQMAA